MRVLGIGSALVDLLAFVEPSWLAKSGTTAGGMTLVDPGRLEQLLGTLSGNPPTAPGGSACNTLVGLARLGVQTRFVGKVGQDPRAASLRSALEASGMETRFRTSATATGTVLSVVTPDAQRTMFTSLGAAAELTPDEVTEELFADVDLVHLEGYLAFNAPVFRKVMEICARLKLKVSLDLASFETVGVCRALFEEALPHLHLLIANEDEARAFTGLEPEAALEYLAQRAPVAVVKLGAEGSLVARGTERAQAQAFRVKAVDTTGAGDLWASGFLAGHLQGMSLEASAQLGSRVASEVVQVLGAAIPEEGWQTIRQWRQSAV